MKQFNDIISIQNFSQELFDIINTPQSKDRVIREISERIQLFFSGIESRYSFTEFDEVLITFFSLLEQILFEQNENYPADSSVRESIFENLTSRLTVLCEALIDINRYSSNLQNRKFLYEDTVIIKKYKLESLTGYLIDIFQDYPDLHKNILKTLVSIKKTENKNFFYQITSGSYCYELRLIALLGLKEIVNNLKNQSHFKTQNEIYNQAVDIILLTDDNLLFLKNYDNYYIDLYLVYLAELDKSVFLTKTSLLNLLLRIDYSLKKNRTEQLPDLTNSIANILLFFSLSQYEIIIQNLELMKIFISIIDRLPAEYAVTINKRITGLNSSLTVTLNNLFSLAEIRENEQSAIRYISFDI